MSTMTAHGVTLTIERHTNDGYPKWEINGPRYRGTFPECGCERAVCQGRCPGAMGTIGRERHNAANCHGWHAETVEAFARKVLETYAHAARKPWTPSELAIRWTEPIPDDIQAQIAIALAERKAQGLRPDPAIKLPGVGAPRDPYYTIGNRCFLPLEGEETVSVVPWAHHDKWNVLCDSVRCRVGPDLRVVAISTWPSAALAEGAAARHRDWHKAPQTIEAQTLTLRLTVPEIEVGDWYHNADGWQRIAMKQDYRAGTRSVMIWDAADKLIGTLDIFFNYLIVRGDEDPPNWTPTHEQRKAKYVPGGAS